MLGDILRGEEYKEYCQVIEDRLEHIVMYVPLEKIEIIKGTPSKERIQHNLGHFRFTINGHTVDECWICLTRHA